MLEIVKLLLGIPKDDDSKDEVLQLYIDIVVTRILNLCNLNKLPYKLELTASQLVVNLYTETYGDNNSGKISGAVSSITEGERTVSFATNSKNVTEKADFHLSLIKSELNKFKQLYKTSPPKEE